MLLLGGRRRHHSCRRREGCEGGGSAGGRLSSADAQLHCPPTLPGASGAGPCAGPPNPPLTPTAVWVSGGKPHWPPTLAPLSGAAFWEPEHIKPYVLEKSVRLPATRLANLSIGDSHFHQVGGSTSSERVGAEVPGG